MDLDRDTGPALPSPQAFLTSILTSLSTLPTEGASNGTSLSASSKTHLLTLHALLPGTLLSALDLLDRGLITRFATSAPTSVYYARSAPSGLAERSSRHSRQGEGPLFEVRTTAWNCECPAFAFAAFDGLIDAEVDIVRPRPNQDEGWAFGGLAIGEEVPVCKHLLACVLAEKWPTVMGGQIREVEISREELAGWAAGWGRG